MSAPRTFWLVTGVVLLSRLPFLGAGYGWDSDAWRVAALAQWIVAHGHYAASRFPGNPVHELLCALLVRGGPWALNGISAVASAIGAGCFAVLLRRLGVRYAALGAFALASTPAFYVASVSTMDYALTLGLLLAALERAHAEKAIAAGLLLGLAIGCRLTTAAMILPLGLILAGAEPAGQRRALVFAATALAVGAIAFAPVLVAYGPAFFTWYDHGYPSALVVLKKVTVDFFGVVGAATLALVVLAQTVRRRGALRPAEAAAWGLGCALGVATFLSLPYKPAYLLPALPFGLLLIARWLPPRAFALACLGLVLSPWVFLVEHGQLRPAAGIVTRDHERRLADMEYVGGVLERAGALAAPSIIVAHDWQPQVRVRAGGDAVGPARFVYLLTADELARARADGARLYYLAGADEAEARERGVDLAQAGATPL